jgi:hypothetical protein
VVDTVFFLRRNSQVKRKNIPSHAKYMMGMASRRRPTAGNEKGLLADGQRCLLKDSANDK